MALNPGQALSVESVDSETRVAAEAIDEGDAVTFNASGEALAAGDTDVIYGIAGGDHISDGYEAGDTLQVITAGANVVANVASGVTPVTALGGSTTAGELAAGSSERGIIASRAEGEGPESIPDGFGFVTL
jgi:hypothetical protein